LNDPPRAVLFLRGHCSPHLRHPLAGDLDARVLVLLTKRTGKRSETRPTGTTRRCFASSISHRLRSLTTITQCHFTHCHAGGQGFESPTPRQQ